MNIFNKLREDVINIGKRISTNHEILNLANIEIPKDHLNGDLSTNIAMIIASKEKVNPREVAIRFKELLAEIPYIVHIEVAGSGFINFTLKADIWHECIKTILSGTSDFYEVNVGQNAKVNIEYVSANPTGPLHIGHARGAVYGDALAKLMKKAGFQVTKEYYVNDAGSQIDDLTKTVLLRYKEALSGQKIDIPEGLYPGEYLIEVGQKLVKDYGKELLSMPPKEAEIIIKKYATAQMLNIIKEDLKELQITHDVFFSEQSLHDNEKIEEVVQLLTEMGLIYEGYLPPPKGKIDEEWSTRAQKLFRATNFGDDQDRPVQKADGTWTYLAADLAYAKDKIDRGFDQLIYILGADHSGYVRRIEAVVKALGKGKVKCEVKICQLVNYMENDVPIKMSKRSGTFTTVRDVTNEVGKDIIRFIMLTRRNDAPLDFDLVKVKEQSKDNPVFYVQYAYVRVVSILANSKEIMPLAYEKFLNNEFDLSLLSSEEEIQLIKLLAAWPKILEGAAKYLEPHRIAFYLQNIAAKFHHLWNLGKEDNDYRFIIESDVELTAARLALAESLKKIIACGLEIVGVAPLTRM